MSRSDLEAYLEESASQPSSTNNDVGSNNSDKSQRPKILRWMSALVKQRSKLRNHQKTSSVPSMKRQNTDNHNDIHNENDDAKSIHSRRPASVSSAKSHASRLSRMSGSSQRSYENPVLESMQTILDLVTCLEARNKPPLFAGLGGSGVRQRNRERANPQYRIAVEFKEQVQKYVEHPAVINSWLHTSPKELVDLCHRVKAVDPYERDPDLLSVNASILNTIAVELKDWFEAFLVAPRESSERQPGGAYVPSPLRYEVHIDSLSREVETASEVQQPDQGVIIVVDDSAMATSGDGEGVGVAVRD